MVCKINGNSEHVAHAWKKMLHKQIKTEIAPELPYIISTMDISELPSILILSVSLFSVFTIFLTKQRILLIQSIAFKSTLSFLLSNNSTEWDRQSLQQEKKCVFSLI